MSHRYKVLFAGVVALMLAAGLGKSDQQPERSGLAFHSGAGRLASHPGGMLAHFELVVSKKGRESLRALPSAGALLAGLTLVLPFAFSTYRSLYRKADD
jgi:hypothetical protein